MAAVPVKFFFGFMLLSIMLWLTFIIIAKLVAWYLSRVVGASISLRLGGWKCIKDIVIKFNKSPFESISIGEIRLSLRQSLVKLGFGFLSRDPKLQVLLCDIEIVMRPSSRSSQKAKSSKSHAPRTGKLMLIINMSRFISLSVTDLVVKMPIAAFECKEICLDVSKNDGSKSKFLLRLNMLPFTVHPGKSRFTGNQLSGMNLKGCPDQRLTDSFEQLSAPFSCEGFGISCEFCHDRDVGIASQNLEICFGQVNLNLSEDLFLKSKSSTLSKEAADSVASSSLTEKPQKKQAFHSLSKYAAIFPERTFFSLPKLDLAFAHRGQNLLLQNGITGIRLKILRSSSTEDAGDCTRFDIRTEFSEIHLLRDTGVSILEILKVDVVSSLYIPMQLNFPARLEIDVKFGGTRCNIMTGRLKPLLSLQSTIKKKTAPAAHSSDPQLPHKKNSKVIAWTSTVSAPEMVVVLYSMNNSPLCHVCSQSSHVFANNISSSVIEVHAELGEINAHMEDDYHESLKESLFGVETNTYSLMHVAKVSLDWSKKELQDEKHSVFESNIAVDLSGINLYFTLKRLMSLLSTCMNLKFASNSFPGSVKNKTQNPGLMTTNSSTKGNRLLKLNLERCSISFCCDVGLENVNVADPKKVNYGSQGGGVVVSTLPDGKSRYAIIMSTLSDGCKSPSYTALLDIYHLSVTANKEKQSTQIELERARCNYQEHSEHGFAAEVVLFDMQNAKFVRCSGGSKEISLCSYFSALNIAVRWEPDVHLSFFEVFLNLKSHLLNLKVHETRDESMTHNAILKQSTLEATPQDKKRKKSESTFAVDVEVLNISAQLGDGVDATVNIQSIFSENVRIGLLFEGFTLEFNESRVLKSTRMQISCIPSLNCLSDAKSSALNAWDLLIQGFDLQICMPFRLQLRAIEDSVEDMLRGLKLIATAQKKQFFPSKIESSATKKSGGMRFGSLKLCISKLTVEIEEEPIQGWLDEHYQHMKNEAYEVAVRMKYLDDMISRVSQHSGDELSDTHGGGFSYNGIHYDMNDSSAVNKMREDIYLQSFRSYYLSCQKILVYEGSGACKTGFHAGFKPSTSRRSLLSISATELDVCLTKIEGGNAGIIKVVKKLDPVCEALNVPFSRFYGSNILLKAGSLSVQLRNFPPMFSGIHGKCQGRLVLAQQATCLQPQIYQEVFIGRWRKINMLRSVSGTTPPMKTYMDLPLSFEKAEISFGVGYEPPFADISYAFTVALRRANLTGRNIEVVQPPKKEKSLPWWDDVRNYVHGQVTLSFSETSWNIFGTTDPYENLDKLQVFTSFMEIKQSDGHVCVRAEAFRIFASSLDCLVKRRSLNPPQAVSGPILVVPAFSLDVEMDWECDSGNPLNHYLHALPNEGEIREKVYDPFRSTSLSLRWNFLLRPASITPISGGIDDCQSQDSSSVKSPMLNLGSHDLAWIVKFWNLNFLPPHKLRTFSRWPRYGVPRLVRSGNLALDKVMTEFMLRIDASPCRITHVPLRDDDPAKGLFFKMSKLKFELYFTRGKQKYTFESMRDLLDLVYQGIDCHVLKAFVEKHDCSHATEAIPGSRLSQSPSMENLLREKASGCPEKVMDDGFLLSSDYFTIRKQAPKADPSRLLSWQEAGKNHAIAHAHHGNGSESDEHARSDWSDDDGFNVVIADDCQRVFVYGLKLLWTIQNRNAVWSWVSGISRAFELPKPSPSRQYAQKKNSVETQLIDSSDTNDDLSTNMPCTTNEQVPSEPLEAPVTHAFLSGSDLIINSEDDGLRHFMVNVIEPQFNLHSEEANGRFLLAAVSGRVLARSFHSILHVGQEIIEETTGDETKKVAENEPEMTWMRMEISAMLEQVQAHVAPTDVDPGAGLQWLPKILRSSPKVKRTGALLERVFMPCDMFFRYTRHKGGSADHKVRPLKELTFNSHNITATMTSRQFQVMLDVLTNLLFARLPKSQKSGLGYLTEDDSDAEEEADEVVPSGVEEVELARIHLEQKEQELKLLFDDIRKLSLSFSNECPVPGLNSDREGDAWMVTSERATLVQELRKGVGAAQKSRKQASASVRSTLQKAAQMRLMEKDKNKSPSYAMRVSVRIDTVVMGMLIDGKSFAEAEISDMVFDFERDYKDIGLSRFTTKYFVIRNCLVNAKSDMLLCAWNPPPEWGKRVMLRVDAKQSAPKDGNAPLELFQVDIYPLKIHLTEGMYRMMWGYFFPEEEQDSLRRQEVWKVSTTAGAKRSKKTSSSSSIHDPAFPSKDLDAILTASASKQQNLKANTELRRTSSFDRTWEESVAETVANELVLHVQSKSGNLEQPEEQQGKSRAKDSSSASRPKDSKQPARTDEKKAGKQQLQVQDEKRPRKMMEFHNIKISQVELLVTYEGSRFAVSDLRLLMDTFHRPEFVGTWRRLFARVKKHIIWGVLKSVTGMQGKKFKDKAHKDPVVPEIPDIDLHFSDSDGGARNDQYALAWPKRPGDSAGDGFVTSVKGLFNSQRRKAKAFVLRTMRGEAENDFLGEWSEGEADFSPFARQLTITKARKLIRRHTKKFRSRAQRTPSLQRDSVPSSSIDTTPFRSESSGESAAASGDDLHEMIADAHVPA